MPLRRLPAHWIVATTECDAKRERSVVTLNSTVRPLRATTVSRSADGSSDCSWCEAVYPRTHLRHGQVIAHEEQRIGRAERVVQQTGGRLGVERPFVDDGQRRMSIWLVRPRGIGRLLGLLGHDLRIIVGVQRADAQRLQNGHDVGSLVLRVECPVGLHLSAGRQQHFVAAGVCGDEVGHVVDALHTIIHLSHQPLAFL